MTQKHFSASAHLHEPLPDLPSWVDFFLSAEIPVLQSTAETLEALRANEDLTDANSIGEMISGDPLMTLKVFARASAQLSQRVVKPAETATAALVMMGISPFFKAFPPQHTVEDRLAEWPQAMQGLNGVLRRAHRSADFALAFSVHRTDPNAAAIHAAALLHEFAELLLWLHAPGLAHRIHAIQDEDSTMRSYTAQQLVLGIRLDELQNRLVSVWKLPTLLGNLDGQEPSGNPGGIRTVTLAANLARHTAVDWSNPAIPNDLDEIGNLLNISSGAALALATSVDSS